MQRQLWPGTFVNVDLTTSVVPNALTIPTNALQQNDKGQFVYVVGADKRVSVRPVEVAQRLHGVALISKGLQAGETVVVQGQYRLTPGTLVVATAPSERAQPLDRQLWNAALNLSSGFHHQADRNRAHDGRGRGAGDRQLPAASRRCVAQYRYADDPGDGPDARGGPANDGVLGDHSTRTAIRRDPRLNSNDFEQRHGIYLEITLQFDRSRTVDSAAEDVQAAINATQAQLPISLLTSPIYRKTNPADTPILLISMTSDVLPIMTVSDYAYSILAQKLSQVPGVGLVTVGGNAKSGDPNPAQPGPARRDES